MKRLEDCYRKIHLDFDNNAVIQGIGAKFDGNEFAKRLSDAHVDAVVVFAADTHGLAYYDTKLGNRHPGLELDLLKEQVSACHKTGILISAYFNVVQNEFAKQNSEWKWRQYSESARQEGKQDQTEEPRFGALCLNSPFVDEFLLPHVTEVLEGYEVDGLWFDIVSVPNNFCGCKWCDALRQKQGSDPNDPEARLHFAGWTQFHFVERVSQHARAICPDISLDYNCILRVGSRKYLPYVTNFDIEAVHGQNDRKGYFYLPFIACHLRTLDVPLVGMTSRFYYPWSDFGACVEADQLRYECSRFLAHGLRCDIGDQALPDGRLNSEAYRVIGEVYSEVEEKEPWCVGAQPVSEVAILADEQYGGNGTGKPGDTVMGMVRMLLELHVQFDIIDSRADFSRYRLLLLPNNSQLVAEVCSRIREFAANGGHILAEYMASYDARKDTLLLGDLLGVRWEGKQPFSLGYFRLREEIAGAASNMDHIIHAPFAKVSTLKSSTSTILADFAAPWFENTGDHFALGQAPPKELSGHPAIITTDYSAYIASDIFSSYFQRGITVHRHIIYALLQRLLPDPLVELEGLPSVEVALHRQGKRAVLHLVQFHGRMKADESFEIVEDIPVRHDVHVKVRLPWFENPPTRVYMAPTNKEVPFQIVKDVVAITVPELQIHAMVVLE